MTLASRGDFYSFFDLLIGISDYTADRYMMELYIPIKNVGTMTIALLKPPTSPIRVMSE